MGTWKCHDGESTQVSQGPTEAAPSACAVPCGWGTSPPGGPQDCVWYSSTPHGTCTFMRGVDGSPPLSSEPIAKWCVSWAFSQVLPGGIEPPDGLAY